MVRVIPAFYPIEMRDQVERDEGSAKTDSLLAPRLSFLVPRIWAMQTNLGLSSGRGRHVSKQVQILFRGFEPAGFV
jgi:hypothetical protein